ncbi:uncharacterized protein TRUGW13939_09696 [Talaromyces rugulosus]|uniref:Peptidase A1 domain-containing protein n=1 Tax=Talaromyces rugulosus TaxID=121627 RepID=A0A7H8RAR7_TALRU|nr:uncharacterized protein TRUGW13939_09696 [Talaromyces rugulosus]QKX62535.1 hypothetical protein TRUGW13939_09696 [Talaromyces rugulosus]
MGNNITLYVPSHANLSQKIPWKWRGDNMEIDGPDLNGTLVYRDNIIMHDGPVSVNQALAIANPSRELELPQGALAYQSWDGLLSLTRQNASLLFIQDGETTLISHASWFDNILPQLRDPVIGIALRHQDEGFIDLGWTNSKMYSDKIQWAYSNSLATGYWAFHVNSWKIGTQPAVPCDFDMQINTGTRYTTLDPGIVNNFRAQVALQMDTETLGESMYYKCNITLPNVTLTVDRAGGGTFDLDIPGKAFKLGENDDGTCEFGLVSMGGFNPDDFGGESALGITALRTLYVVLNASESIGFAPQVDIPIQF